jgi:hypothetical protein
MAPPSTSPALRSLAALETHFAGATPSAAATLDTGGQIAHFNRRFQRFGNQALLTGIAKSCGVNQLLPDCRPLLKNNVSITMSKTAWSLLQDSASKTGKWPVGRVPISMLLTGGYGHGSF